MDEVYTDRFEQGLYEKGKTKNLSLRIKFLLESKSSVIHLFQLYILWRTFLEVILLSNSSLFLIKFMMLKLKIDRIIQGRMVLERDEATRRTVE